jgi:dienelactone hydrolase
MKKGWLLLLLLFLPPGLAGCLALSPEVRRSNAGQMAAASEWGQLRLPAGRFVLAGYLPKTIPANNTTLTIYIEGDGLAWINPSLVSPDPTPVTPVGLALALRHPRGAAAYLARPCQYVEGDDTQGCSTRYWTNLRFSPEVVDSANQAIGLLKEQFQATQLVLVGYSGGGAVAALVAARRHDVALLVTVAGNLDHQAWTTQHHATPLTGSLNPADAWPQLLEIPQIHFAGGKDQVVGPEVAESFANHFPADRRPEIRVIPGFNHTCCWAEQWPKLFNASGR